MQEVCIDLYIPRARPMVSPTEARSFHRSAGARPIEEEHGVSYLGNASTQKGTNEVFESLKLRLDDNETEVRLRVRAARLFLDDLDLQVRRWY